MKEPSLSTVKKYLLALTKSKKKYVTSESLSLTVGVYPEVINETLSYFNPMVNMDYKFNLLDLVPEMKKFVEKKKKRKNLNPLDQWSKRVMSTLLTPSPISSIVK